MNDTMANSNAPPTPPLATFPRIMEKATNCRALRAAIRHS